MWYYRRFLTQLKLQSKYDLGDDGDDGDHNSQEATTFASLNFFMHSM